MRSRVNQISRAVQLPHAHVKHGEGRVEARLQRERRVQTIQDGELRVAGSPVIVRRLPVLAVIVRPARRVENVCEHQTRCTKGRKKNENKMNGGGAHQVATNAPLGTSLKYDRTYPSVVGVAATHSIPNLLGTLRSTEPVKIVFWCVEYWMSAERSNMVLKYDAVCGEKYGA